MLSVISLLSSDVPNTDSPANVDAAVRNFCSCMSWVSFVLTTIVLTEGGTRESARISEEGATSGPEERGHVL